MQEMCQKPLFSGEQIYSLIPQRPPIVMVDALYSYEEGGAETGLTVRGDNIFVEDGRLAEPGLMEHVAQSAAAFAGYGTFSKGIAPKLGYIAEVRKFRIHCLPETGAVLHTSLKILGSAGGMSLLSAETWMYASESDVCSAETGQGYGTVPVASGQMKIFIKDE